MSDSDLLQAFVKSGSNGAFRELVEHHVDFVYSIARRLVRSAALAEEVTQQVFCDLARQAPQLDANRPLAAWLHVVTRRSAIDLIRREARRAALEQHAAIAHVMNSPEPNWTAVEPVLDEAVASLRPDDRDAVLLRYFQNKPLRDVGIVLGLSEDAAQKRVSRALERLRDFLRRRGIEATAAALATDLSAHALVSAPAGIGTTISAAALAGGTATAVAAAGHVFVMTTLHKAALVGSFAAAVAVGGYQTVALGRERSLARAAEARIATIDAVQNKASVDARAVREHLASVEHQIDGQLAPKASADPGNDAGLRREIDAWSGRVAQLKQSFAVQPDQSCPELNLLDDNDWYVVAAQAKFDGPEEVRRARAGMRRAATQKVSLALGQARGRFQAANGRTPSSIQELAGFMDPALDASILNRCAFIPSGPYGPELVYPVPPIDVEYDSVWEFAARRNGTASAASFAIREAVAAFSAANPGRSPSSGEQLVPYLRWPVAPTLVNRYLETAQKGGAR